ncbi:MAG: hypothetical protein RL481_1480 [Pseudomonadota bacterium]|jgi:hypothetical protein
MSIHYPAAKFADIAERVATPNIRQDVDRSFELPTSLYVATVGLYFAFLAVMAIGFQTREMALVIAICVVYVIMAFGVPAMWVRMKPDHRSRAMDSFDYRENGIVTHTGLTKAKDATAQVLILPILIFFWGAATATISTLVS